jgi:hypothetical protein
LITPSEAIIHDANETTDIHDSLGRTLKVRRLKVLDRFRLLKVAGPDLSKNDAWLNMAALTFAVVEIDSVPRPVPTNERQIEATISLLSDAGLQAVADALNDIDRKASVFEGSPEGNVVGTPI